ncbi:1613_t:CDS:2, partial [Dentiscutata erythropus]
TVKGSTGIDGFDVVYCQIVDGKKVGTAKAEMDERKDYQKPADMDNASKTFDVR